MAKRGTPSTAKPELQDRDATPLPPEQLDTTCVVLPAGTLLHRVHHQCYAADQFNPGVQGNARFSPILNERGEPIPTLYAGDTLDCALMETVFHDVPYAAGLKTFDKGKLTGQVHSIVEVTQDLQLLDLASVPLRKLGISRKQLIDTEKERYPVTRLWAEAFYQQRPTAQGLSWISRQDDSARAVMLFGQRLDTAVLRPLGESRGLIENAATYDHVLDLATRLGVLVVPGHNGSGARSSS